MVEHDIICLIETWTNKNSTVDFKGYSNPIHSYRRFQHRKARRSSGGIIVYIRDSIRKGVSLVRNNIDCLLWLKIDKTHFNIEDDIYLAVIYIPPENSPMHDMYDVNIFELLESDINFFDNKGKVFITGDANARTGHKADFIDNDRSLGDFDLFEIDTLLQHTLLLVQIDLGIIF